MFNGTYKFNIVYLIKHPIRLHLMHKKNYIQYHFWWIEKYQNDMKIGFSSLNGLTSCYFPSILQNWWSSTLTHGFDLIPIQDRARSANPDPYHPIRCRSMIGIDSAIRDQSDQFRANLGPIPGCQSRSRSRSSQSTRLDWIGIGRPSGSSKGDSFLTWGLQSTRVCSWIVQIISNWSWIILIQNPTTFVAPKLFKFEHFSLLALLNFIFY